MKLYDAHSHLHFAENNEALKKVLEEGNMAVCDCSVSPMDLDDLHEKSSARRDVFYPAYGIHPMFLPNSFYDFPESKIAIYLKDASAVGEIGLDKHAETDYDLQIKFLKLQLNLAEAFNLPAVIHCRKAWGDMLKILTEYKLARGVLIHAANCSPEIAKELSGINAVFSFGMRELGGMRGLACLASLPLERVLIESDGASDYADLEKTLAVVADLKGESVESAGRIIEENFLKFFGGE